MQHFRNTPTENANSPRQIDLLILTTMFEKEKLILEIENYVSLVLV